MGDGRGGGDDDDGCCTSTYWHKIVLRTKTSLRQGRWVAWVVGMVGARKKGEKIVLCVN